MRRLPYVFIIAISFTLVVATANLQLEYNVLAQGSVLTEPGRNYMRQQAKESTCTNPAGRYGSWMVPGNVYLINFELVERNLSMPTSQIAMIETFIASVGQCYEIRSTTLTTRNERAQIRVENGYHHVVSRIWNDSVIIVVGQKKF